MNFVEVTHGGRLGHEPPQALVEGAIDEEIGAALGASLVAE
jgi:hypothetical protein